MNKQNTSFRKLAQQPSDAQRGVVLLEALVSVLLFSMGVLALVGLQAAMIKNTSDSKFRSEASYIAQQRVGLMWADPDNAAALIETDTVIDNLLPTGRRTVAQPDSVNFPERFEVTVTWRQPGESQHRFTTIANIAGG